MLKHLNYYVYSGNSSKKLQILLFWSDIDIFLKCYSRQKQAEDWNYIKMTKKWEYIKQKAEILFFFFQKVCALLVFFCV